MYLDILRQCGSSSTMFLSYDVREGMLLTRFGEA